MNNTGTKKLIVASGTPSPNLAPERVVLVNEAGDPIDIRTSSEIAALTTITWKPNTAYIAGTVVSYQGNLYSVNVDYTSGSSWTGTGLTAFSSRFASPVARFVQRATAGETLKISCVGDSILEGQTVTNTAADGLMILLAADLATRYGTTITQVNHASSGYTTARSFISGDVASAIAEAADLYLIAFGKNDIGMDTASTVLKPGYKLNDSIQQMERMIRLFRSKVPKADIVLVAENPYTGVDSDSNTRLQAYNTAMKQLAAVYGCLFVDCYSPFTALGDYTAYMYDSTHPNTAGHRLMANTILAAFPISATGISKVADPPAIGFYPQAGLLEDSVNGWEVGSNPGARSHGTWARTGTWVSDTSTTPGSYVEATFTGTECLAQLSTLSADALVGTVKVDGTDVTISNDFTTGKKGTYWVPLATGLSPGSHTVRLTLVTGTLKVTAMAWTVAKVFAATKAVQVLANDATIYTLTGSYQNVLGGTKTIELPDGWNSMDVFFTGLMQPRVLATTTDQRTFSWRLTDDGVAMGMVAQFDAPATTYNAYQPVQSLTFAKFDVTADMTIALDVRVTSSSTDKCTINSKQLNALLVRKT